MGSGRKPLLLSSQYGVSHVTVVQKISCWCFSLSLLLCVVVVVVDDDVAVQSSDSEIKVSLFDFRVCYGIKK